MYETFLTNLLTVPKFKAIPLSSFAEKYRHCYQVFIFGVEIHLGTKNLLLGWLSEFGGRAKCNSIWKLIST